MTKSSMTHAKSSVKKGTEPNLNKYEQGTVHSILNFCTEESVLKLKFVTLQKLKFVVTVKICRMK